MKQDEQLRRFAKKIKKVPKDIDPIPIEYFVDSNRVKVVGKRKA